MSENLQSKIVAVTGACGTVGKELIKQLIESEYITVAEVLCLDNDESGLFFLDQDYLEDKRVKTFYVDIRDLEELKSKLKNVDIVFHCAAMKHVIVCEKSPEQAISTNITGVKNIIEACRYNNAEKLIFTSSDKAVNPTNVMGTTKLMGERLVTAANSISRDSRTIFASTRFGNVLGSSGSVVPIFQNQMLQGKAVTVTHNDMTRFIMSMKDAAKLVIDAVDVVRGGEVLVMKMPVVRIIDLAKAMAKELHATGRIKSPDIEIRNIGIKPGEKLYEELMSDEETRRTVELKDYYSVLPAFRNIYGHTNYDYSTSDNLGVDDPYHSGQQDYLSIERIRDYLRYTGVLDAAGYGSTMRYWPGDR